MHRRVRSGVAGGWLSGVVRAKEDYVGGANERKVGGKKERAIGAGYERDGYKLQLCATAEGAQGRRTRRRATKRQRRGERWRKRARECDGRRETESAACSPDLTGGRGKGYIRCAPRVRHRAQNSGSRFDSLEESIVFRSRLYFSSFPPSANLTQPNSLIRWESRSFSRKIDTTRRANRFLSNV